MSSFKLSAISSGARNRAVRMAVGLIAGGLLGFFIVRADHAGALVLHQLSWSQTGGLLLGAVMTLAGIGITAVSFSGRLMARAMDPDAGGAPRPGQTIFYRQQGLVLLLAGLMMGAPVVAGLLLDPMPRVLASAIMMGLVAMALVQTLLNLSVWNRADELMRRTIAETGAVCFWVLQAIFFLWAAAEVLGLAPRLSSWDLMVLLMAFYLLTSSLLAVRRGFV